MKSIRRRFCRALLALAALLEFSTQAQTFIFSNPPAMAIPRRASIVLIVADGLGYGDLSCYGQAQFQTPNLDKLAADGVRFTNFSTEKTTADAQAVFMLGKTNADIPLGLRDITVAQMLRAAGYRTGLIGEWDLGDENSIGAPWRKGFDEFAGYLNDADAKNLYANYIFRYAPKAIYDETNKTFQTYVGKETLWMKTDDGKNPFIPDILTKAACNFIKDNMPDDANHHQPFFLLLHYAIPGDGSGHSPSDAPYSDEPWPQPEKYKASLVSHLDGYVGQIRDQLEQLGMTNNVAVFFTSDSIVKKANGIDPKFFHSNANDLRVPMIAFWPDSIPSNQVSSLKWSAKDFLPTAAQIGYIKTVKDTDGKSILPEVNYRGY